MIKLETQEQQSAIATLQEIISIPSITGNEVALASHLRTSLAQLEPARLLLQEGEAFRANVIATFPGQSSGELLLFAHLDTVTVDGWTEYWDNTSPNDPRRDPFAGAIVDGQLWARGAGDVKGGIATVIAAIQLLRHRQIPLQKTVTVAFVSDEESGEPEMGLSAGIKAALPVIAESNSERRFAIYLEPTDLDLYVAQMGFQIIDVRVTGRTAYFGTPELGVDALRIAHEILTALWKHNSEIGLINGHPLIGAPNLLVTNMRAGGLIAVPGTCEFSLIRKVTPGESMDDAGAALERAIRSVVVPDGARVDITFSASRDHEFGGTPLENEISSEMHALQNIVKLRQPERVEMRGAPYWSESPLISTSLGIPSIYWAAGDISNCHTPQERIKIDDYFDAIASLADYMAAEWQ